MRRASGTSITTSSFSTKKLIWVKHCRDNLAFIREKHPELEHYAVARYRGSILWTLTEIALAKDSFEKETNELIAELRRDAQIFWKTPFAFWQDRIRMIMLMYGPFGLYRALIKKKRQIQ